MAETDTRVTEHDAKTIAEILSSLVRVMPRQYLVKLLVYLIRSDQLS